ncbi:MAG: putative ABC transport system permease protein [Planctomycetota bacterium]|jgi:putative ABC transport system permease protein
MSLPVTLARRSLLQRPARTLLSILGIAVGIATVVGVYTLDVNTVEGLKTRYAGDQDADWKPEFEVSPAPGLSDPRSKLTSIEGISDAAAFFQNEVELQPLTAQGEAAESVRARLLAVDAEVLPRMDAYDLLAGADITPGRQSPEVLIGPKLASRLGLSPGMQIELARPARSAPRVCLDGEMQRKSGTEEDIPVAIQFTIAGVFTPEKLGRRANGEIVVVEYKWGEELYRGARTSPRYWVQPDPVANLDDIQSRLAGNFAYDMTRSVVIGQEADERAYRNGVFMAGLLALMLGLYVIFHTLSMSLVERIREVGVLHALGASRAQVGRVFLLEAVILSTLGGVLGLVAGVFMAKGLLKIGITTLGTGKLIDSFRVPLGVLPLAAIGVGTALMGSVFPLLRARNANTIDALRGEKAMESGGTTNSFHVFSTLLIAILLPALYFTIVPVVGEASSTLVASMLLAVGILGLLLSVPLLMPSALSAVCRFIAKPLTRVFPFAGSMASHTMMANPRRIAVSSAAIALVCAAFVGLKGMTASLRGEVHDWAETAVENKLWVRNMPKVSFDKLSTALHELPEVLGVEPGSARIHSPFLFIGQRSSELQGYGPLAGKPNLRQKFDRENGIIISKRVANNLGYKVGGEVQVRVGTGEVVGFEVLAISDEYGYFPHPDERMYGVISETYMKKFFCVEVKNPELIAVRMTDGADTDSAKAIILDVLKGRGKPSFLTGSDLQTIQVKDIANDFLLFDLILSLTALLAALGVLNGQLLSALERSKELGILRALGASKSQISGMVWLESGVMGLFGGLLGLGLGNLLSPIIIRALEFLSGLELPLRGAGDWNWITLFSAILIALLASAYPVWRMNRTDSVRAVRTGG